MSVYINNDKLTTDFPPYKNSYGQIINAILIGVSRNKIPTDTVEHCEEWISTSLIPFLLKNTEYRTTKGIDKALTSMFFRGQNNDKADNFLARFDELAETYVIFPDVQYDEETNTTTAIGVNYIYPDTLRKVRTFLSSLGVGNTFTLHNDLDDGITSSVLLVGSEENTDHLFLVVTDGPFKERATIAVTAYVEMLVIAGAITEVSDGKYTISKIPTETIGEQEEATRSLEDDITHECDITASDLDEELRNRVVHLLRLTLNYSNPVIIIGAPVSSPGIRFTEGVTDTTTEIFVTKEFGDAIEWSVAHGVLSSLNVLGELVDHYEVSEKVAKIASRIRDNLCFEPDPNALFGIDYAVGSVIIRTPPKDDSSSEYTVSRTMKMIGGAFEMQYVPGLIENKRDLLHTELAILALGLGIQYVSADDPFVALDINNAVTAVEEIDEERKEPDPVYTEEEDGVVVFAGYLHPDAFVVMDVKQEGTVVDETTATPEVSEEEPKLIAVSAATEEEVIDHIVKQDLPEGTIGYATSTQTVYVHKHKPTFGHKVKQLIQKIIAWFK